MIFHVRFLDEWLGSSPDIDHMTAWSADMDWMISSDQARCQDDDDEEVDFEELEVLDRPQGVTLVGSYLWPFFAKGERGGGAPDAPTSHRSLTWAMNGMLTWTGIVEGWRQLIDAGCLWKGKPGKPSGERWVKVVSCFNNGWLEETCIILMHLKFTVLDYS